ncbi:hypothetical protein B0I10_101215 [Flavobacterium lacus]|uniref:Uncharacterized protein n=1 Tax=Flavobacterium lacus TaxID=1353778 RepID=A0A328WXW0_9FLAO|nr:hypothetical protein B0I10_101215 [Flavobacterium lacus]
MKKLHKFIIVTLLLLYFVLHFSIVEKDYFQYIQYTMFIILVIYAFFDLMKTKKIDENISKENTMSFKSKFFFRFLFLF